MSSFKEQAHMTAEAGKSKTQKADGQAGNQSGAEAATWGQNFSFLKETSTLLLETLH